jgi:hypothetical protein
MICEVVMKMFVNRTMISYKSETWECIINNRYKATFAKVESNGELNVSVLKILSNDILKYFNNEEIKILFDPRKEKERQEELSLQGKRHCQDCGCDKPIKEFHHDHGKPTYSCVRCWNKVSRYWSPEGRRILRMRA